jgi:hypothetical protein
MIKRTDETSRIFGESPFAITQTADINAFSKTELYDKFEERKTVIFGSECDLDNLEMCPVNCKFSVSK